ncbi:MAG: tRNA (adenosine(37)-N6)-dimethylallyltransferase MiaA [Planctomycetes bacterium]|nr:tRNA (adenosine(37)-N6)-dimethylallyltransferase MiaA [Planctomycetota bacterium]
MLNDMKPPELDLLIGPTACGKSGVALELARRQGGEILSVDSMKLYKRLEIGVAKPSAAERAAVRHRLIDLKEPWESCSVAEWLAAAEEAWADARARGVYTLAEGGTALYIKALREGLFEGPGRDEGLRKGLEEEARAEGLAALYARLKSIDPAAAQKILPGDERRIIRALEVHALTGQPISVQQAQWGKLREDARVRVVGLQMDRTELYRRIDARIDGMLARGWLDECRALLSLERPLSKEAAQALGYRTLFAHLRGELSLDEARQRICFDTHHFARRQLMWYRKFPAVAWIEVAPDEPAQALADRVAAAFANA